MTRRLNAVGGRALAAAAFALTATAASAQSGEAPAGESRTIRATRIVEAPVLDGRLDEAVYASTPPIDGFLQQEPLEGAPVTERTVTWLFFDDRNIYIAARCDDSQPERDVANEMRRDGQSTNDNESFGVMFDTFHDRRNGYLFQVTLAGGMFDGVITDERDMNRDWNGVWNARTARYDGGWSVEIAIPFQSLRYRSGDTQVWGVNFKRVVRWKNEMQYLTQIPAALGRRGINRVSAAATLVGLTPPATGLDIELKPYGIAGGTSLVPAGGAPSTNATRDAGADVKLGLTDGLTADLTLNTDFAQVEEDEQQVNLTRFSVLFPEKRDFFLEGQGIFSFGGVQGQPRGGSGGAGSAGNPIPSDVPVLFFSRRIGLNNGIEVPIDVGGRVTGKAGPYSVGVIDIRTRRQNSIGLDATNFAVLRVKRDILRRSSIGAIYTERSLASQGTGPARAVGVDGVFSLFQNVFINTYLAKTSTPVAASAAPVNGRDTSYRAQLDYNADRYGLQLERLALDERFLPDVGFLRRPAFTRSSAYARFSPRPQSRHVRKYTWELQLDDITSPTGAKESGLAQGAFRGELQNSDAFGLEVAANREVLTSPFEVSSGVVVPVGDYSFPEVRANYGFGPQRKASGVVTVEHGRFYGGHRTSVSTGRGRVQVTSQLSLEPGIRIDRVRLPQGHFTSTLLTSRASYTMTPRMSASALLQYNSSAATFNSNVRFRWEYSPGSDLFIVYNDNRDTRTPGPPELRGRSFVVKMTRLFRL